MSHLIDELINFDTDYYLQSYPDLQSAIRNLNDVDKKIFLLNHFVKHGYAEKRKYRLKTGHSHGSHHSDKKITKKKYSEKSGKSKNHDSDSDDDLDYKEKDYDSSAKSSHLSSSHHRRDEHNSDDDNKNISVEKRLEEFRRKCKNEKGGTRDKKGNLFLEIDN